MSMKMELMKIVKAHNPFQTMRHELESMAFNDNKSVLLEIKCYDVGVSMIDDFTINIIVSKESVKGMSVGDELEIYVKAKGESK